MTVTSQAVEPTGTRLPVPRREGNTRELAHAHGQARPHEGSIR